MKITILGCGPSSGVPVLGAGWYDCDPDDPRNRRRRSSILVEDGDAVLLVDSSPDCREQLLDAQVERLDAVLFTHAHGDHCHGVDDLRWINVAMKADLPAHASAITLAGVAERFGYAFQPLPATHIGRYYKPVLTPHEITGPFQVAGLDIVPFEQDHGFSTTLGFRFGPAAYSTDLVKLDEAGFAALDGIELWVVDCFRREPHHTHAYLELVLEWIARVKPKRAVLTHMGPTLDYATLKAELPGGVEPAYDGMVLEA
jgi:phosphoribosyl 1,2-cyclic phosphate phosphodiesterase